MGSFKKAVDKQLRAAQTPTDTPGWWTAFGVGALTILLIVLAWNGLKPHTAPTTYAATTAAPARHSTEPAPPATTAPPVTIDDTVTVAVPGTDGHTYTVAQAAAGLATRSCQALFDPAVASTIPWTEPSNAPEPTPTPGAVVSELKLTAAPTTTSSTYIATVTAGTTTVLCTRELTNTGEGWKVVTPL